MTTFTQKTKNNSLITTKGMATLSIRQPAASLILYRGKDVENRNHGRIFAKNGKTFQDDGPKWILIHAGQSRQKGEQKLSHDILQSLGFKDTSAVLEGIDQTRGSIVGAALISAQLRPTDLCESMWASEREYHIIIDTVIAFSKPQPFKGRLGLFPVAWNTLSYDIQKELQHVKDAFVMRLFPKPKH